MRDGLRARRLRAARDDRRAARVRVRVRARRRRRRGDHLRAAAGRVADAGRRAPPLGAASGATPASSCPMRWPAARSATSSPARLSMPTGRRPVAAPTHRGRRRSSNAFRSRVLAAMLYLTIIGGAFIAWLILASLFTPHIPYHIEADVDATSDHFIHVLESTCQTHLEHGNRVEILTNGDRFYPAMLDAIRRRARNRQHGVLHLQEGGDRRPVHRRRWPSGRGPACASRIVMDAIGSVRRLSRERRAAAKRPAAASPPISASPGTASARLNNRTHRELLDRRRRRRVRRRRRRRRLVGEAAGTASRCGAT